MITFCLNSNEKKLTAIVLDIADHILFKAVGIKKVEIDKRSFLKLSFAWSGINIRNYRHGLILKIWWNFTFNGFVMKDIA
jgi:hypothetical protein